MTAARSLTSYIDVQRALDLALEKGGGTIHFAEHRLAVTWRARAYKFRKLFFEAIAKNSPPGVIPTTKYDGLYLRLRKVGAGAEVQISFHREEGTFIAPDGAVAQLSEIAGANTPVEAPTVTEGEAGDELLDIALALAKQHEVFPDGED